jgi:hypothetical protein
VLALLLNGTSFNYVMLGSNSDPTAVSSVILMAKPSSGETQTAANGNPGGMPASGVPSAQPFNRQVVAPQPGRAQAANAEDDDSKDDDQDNAEDDQTQPQPGQPQPGQAVQPNAQDQRGQPESSQPNAGPKTPEQILEELRKQQLQPGGAMINPTPQQPTPQQPTPAPEQ